MNTKKGRVFCPAERDWLTLLQFQMRFDADCPILLKHAFAYLPFTINSITQTYDITRKRDSEMKKIMLFILEEADLKEEAEDYLRSIGLTDEQLDALADKLTDPPQA